ncbi:xylulokinase [bacterium RCC_150]
MSTYLGIDLGTSSARAVVVAGSGKILAISSRSYTIQSPQSGWAEQNVSDWWGAVSMAVKEAVSAAGGPPVSAIGVTGQMHGLVLVDETGDCVRPAIIWPDQRTGSRAAVLADGVSAEWVQQHAGMPPAAGTLALSLDWVRRNEVDSYRKARTALLPKDYIRFRLTGTAASEPSDASGSLLLDVHVQQWSPKLADVFDADLQLLPPLLASTDIAGGLTRNAALALGLHEGTPVVAGGSDQATVAEALELRRLNRVSIGMSSGGTVLRPVATPSLHMEPGVHTLCAVDGTWLQMGAVLSAGLSLAWLARILNPSSEHAYDELVAESSASLPGAKGLIFIPNLRGERTPGLNASATASFRNLTYEHGRPELVRAVLEGVSFALRDCMEGTVGLRQDWPEVVGFGGGLRNQAWRQILADVLGVPVGMTRQNEHSAVGAASLAAAGIGQRLPLDNIALDYTLPTPDRTELYEEHFASYRQLSRAMA